MIKHVEAVIFDLGDTLVHYYSRNEFDHVLEECVQNAAGYASRNMNILLDRNKLARRTMAENHENADYSVRPLLNRLYRIFEIQEDISGQSADQLQREFMKPIFHRARIYEDVFETISWLRQTGYATGLISNSPWGSPAHLWREEIRRLDMCRLFDSTTFCGDVGWRKPDSRIFEHSVQTLGISAENCIYVGDHEKWDVEGGRSAGMKTILIDRNGEARGNNKIEKLEDIISLVQD